MKYAAAIPDAMAKNQNKVVGTAVLIQILIAILIVVVGYLAAQ